MSRHCELCQPIINEIVLKIESMENQMNRILKQRDDNLI